MLRFLRNPAHGVDEGGQIVDRGRSRLKVGGQAYDLPPEGCLEVLGVFVAQIVGIGVGDGGERADDDRRVTVVVGQGSDGDGRAAGL